MYQDFVFVIVTCWAPKINLLLVSLQTYLSNAYLFVKCI